MYTRATITLAALLLAGCKGKDADGESVKVGAVASITGDFAAGSVIRALELAVETVNEAAGVLGRQLELVPADDRSDEGRTKEAAQALIDEGVTAIVGSATSTGTLLMAEATIAAQVVQVSGDATSPEITTWDDDGFLFRTIPSDALQGKLLAQRALAVGHVNAAVLYLEGSYGQGMSDTFREVFEAGGGSVSATVPFAYGAASYTAELEVALAGNPEVVLLVAYVVDGAQILNDYNTSFADRGVAWLFGDGMAADELVTLVGANNFTWDHEGSAPTAEGPGYPAYQAIYPDSPYSLYHTNNFDAVVLLALAMEQAGSTDGVAIRDAMASVSSGGTTYGPDQLAEAFEAIRNGEDIDYAGASGDVDFDADGDVVGPYMIWEVADGGISEVEVGVLPE